MISKLINSIPIMFFAFSSIAYSEPPHLNNLQQIKADYAKIHSERMLRLYDSINTVKSYEAFPTLNRYQEAVNMWFRGISDSDYFEKAKSEYSNMAKDVAASNMRYLYRGDQNEPLFKILSNISFVEDSVDLNFHSKLVTNENCRYNFQYFVGCAESIRFLLLQIDKDQRIQYAKASSNIQSFFPQMSSSNESEIPGAKADMTATEYAKLFKQKKQQVLDSYKKLYSTANSIEGLITDFNKIPKKSSLSEEVIKVGIDQFLINAYDPHSELVSNAQLEKMMNGEVFFGIGANLKQEKDRYIVVNAIEGSPAAAAKVLPNSIITKIDGVDIKEFKSIADVTKALRGPLGTIVKVEMTKNNQVQTYKITRGEIRQPVISNKVLELNSQKFLHIVIPSYMRRELCSHIENAILSHSNVDGVIFDVRNNGGGLTSNVKCLMEMVLPGGSIWTGYNQGNTVQIERTEENSKPIYNGKLALLINSGSASASEMTAQNLRDYERALLVGNKTYGKGSSQALGTIELAGDYSIKLTNALFFAPGGTTNQTAGVKPHLEVVSPDLEITEDASIREADLFNFPIPPVKIETGFTAPEKKISVDKKCLASHKLKEVYKSLHEDDNRKDMQVLSAMAGLMCLEK